MKKLSVGCLICFLALQNSLFTQTSNPPISPKWVFEPCVWEDTNNTKDATWDLINGYLNRGIPTGAVIIDSPWEWPIGTFPYVNNSTDKGYNTFIFDWKYYPQPAQFFQDLNDLGIHIILWITGNMTTNCPNYEYALNNGYFINKSTTPGDTLVTSFWRGNGNCSHIDFFNPAACAYWDSLMDLVLETDSIKIDGWKVDESDYYLPENNLYTYAGVKTKREYQDQYYSHIYNHTVEVKGSEVGMITARPWCKQKDKTGLWYAPIWANTAGWVGDADHNWEDGIQLALSNMFKSANAGYATVGSDIGGFAKAKNWDPSKYYYPNKNLFIRWAQLGALVPIMVNGGQSNKQHYPWLFDEETVKIYRFYAKLHHHLVPYFYSYDIVAHNTGISITRPIGESTTWSGKWYYLLGDNLFVSAICEDNLSKTITFPEGNWIDYWNEDNIYEGGTTRTLTYGLYQYPIFINSGAIIPMNVDDSETGHGSAASKNYLTLLMFPHGSSTFEYHSNPSTTTVIKCDSLCGGFIINFSTSTDSVIIRLRNRIEPGSIILSGNVNLQKKNSFADFEGASSGWFHGKLHDGENVYTWIKFSNSTDTVYVTTTSVSNVNPSNYELSKLNVGNEYYVDRTYTLANIPDEYKGFYMIKTSNDDKTNINLNFHFNICSAADIYIAYDHRLASTTPDWITSNYINTGKVILDIDGTSFDIWKITVPYGIVTLGDNQGISVSSMYFVFYKSYEKPLPVELSIFEAIVNNNIVTLNWQTETEVNNYGFEIERASFSTTPIQEWEKIGFVNGSGNSNSPKNYTFMHPKLNAGKYNYRLKMIDNDGTFEYSYAVQTEVAIPTEYSITQNYPNPFNPSTKIDYQLPFDSKVTIELYSIAGEKVATLINGELTAGYYTTEINADALNLSSGVYIYRMLAISQAANAQAFVQVKKLMLMK